MKSGSEQSIDLDSSTPLWIASRLLIARHGTEFFTQWRKVAESLEEDAVHDLRVASRRLREGLALFSPCFSEKESRRLDRKVKKVTTMLGELRNTDEAVRFFAELTDHETLKCAAELQELMTALRLEREQVHRKLEEELSHLDQAPLKADYDTITEHGNLYLSAGSDPFLGIASYADGAVTVRAATVETLLPDALHERDSAAQHQLRIAVKKLRYRLELLAPLFEEPYQQLHRSLKEYQDVLGKLHDIDVFVDLVQRRVPPGGGRDALLKVMAKRRTALFHDFLDLLQKTSLASIGDRARDALVKPK